MDSLLQYDSSSSDSEGVRNGLSRTEKPHSSDVLNADKIATVHSCSLKNISPGICGQLDTTDISHPNYIRATEGNNDSAVDYFSLHPFQDKSKDICEFDKSTVDRNNWFVNAARLQSVASYEEMWKQQKCYRSWDDSAETQIVSATAGSKQQASKPSKPQRDKDAEIVVIPYKSKRQKLMASKSSEESKSVINVKANNESQATGSNNESQATPELVILKTNFYTVHSKIQPYLFQEQSVSNKKPQKVVKRISAHEGTVNRVKWCVSEYSHLLLSVSMDRTVKIWNAFSSAGKPCVQTLAFHWKAVKDAEWSASGKQLVSCGFDRTARVSDVETGSQLFCCEYDDFVTCVKYHPVQPSVFVAGSLNLLKCCDIRCPSKPVRSYTFKDKIGQMQDLCFLDDGKTFLSCGNLVARDSADRNIMAWDFDSGAVLSNQIYHERYVCTRLCKHPHLPQFLAQSHGDYIVQFDAVPPYKMNQCKRFEGHKVFGYDIGCDISPDGQIVASGSTVGQMWFYDYRSAKVLSTLRTEDTTDVVLNVVWHPVLYSTVAIGTWNGAVEIWQ